MLFSPEEIIERLRERPIEGEPELNTALEIVSTAMHGVKLRNGYDYAWHYLRVGSGTESPEKRVIGILHDVIEDTDWTLDHLRVIGFSDRIIRGIDGVTKRPGEKYFDFIERCSHNPDSVDIKLFDLEHNLMLSRNVAVPGEKQQRKVGVYICSYQYLLAVKKGPQKGGILPGTPMADFIYSRIDVDPEAPSLLSENSTRPERTVKSRPVRRQNVPGTQPS